MELTVEQKRALATAAARKRLQQSAAPAQEPAVAEQNTGVSGVVRGLRAGSEGAGSGALFGFDDELTGAVLSPIEATRDWMKGEGFSIPKAYERVRSSVDARKQSRREQFPKASLAGEVAGGLATGGSAAKAGLTTIGRMGPITGGAVEGAGYGALYGAGEAKPGERLQGAATGGAIGGVTGGLLGGASKAIASRSAAKATAKARAAIPAQSADDLGDEATVLFTQLRNSGVKLPAKQAAAAKADIDGILAGTDKDLAPNAFAIKNVIERKLAGGDVEVLDWHNLSKQINLIARDKKMTNEDARVFGMIKKRFDALRDSNILGPRDAMTAWKQANELTLRKAKVEKLDQIMDFADLDTGQYTQSELSQTIAKRFRELYRSETKSGSPTFNLNELAIIRDIGQAKTQSAILNGLKKLAPRGVVSAALGGMIGNATMGPVGMIVAPAIGEAALRASNRAAVRGAQNFIGDVSRGWLPALPPPGPNIRPFIPGLTGTAGSLPVQR